MLLIVTVYSTMKAIVHFKLLFDSYLWCERRASCYIKQKFLKNTPVALSWPYLPTVIIRSLRPNFEMPLCVFYHILLDFYSLFSTGQTGLFINEL